MAQAMTGSAAVRHVTAFARIASRDYILGRMKKSVTDENGGARSVTVKTAKQVRFASIVAAAGKPEVYLPLLDPKQDQAFMRAAKENRVLSVRQEPTSTRADFGTVGFDEKRFTTLLIFPKPLTDFLDSRIIGIKYDLVAGSRVIPSAAQPSAKWPSERVQKSSRARPERPRSSRSAEAQPPAPPKRTKPKPKEFLVRVRVTVVTEKDVNVKAMTKAEAKKKAAAALAHEGDVRVLDADET